MKLPETWVQARLTDVCELNPRLLAHQRPEDDTTVTFVPMSAVDEHRGVIDKAETRMFAEVAKGYTSFRDHDVLFAKVTPCMENGKAAIARNLNNGLGFGSTEFHVLRSNNVVLPEYIFSFIRQKAFRERAASAFVGTGGLQRVPPDFLSRVKIPLPTLLEQQRIVDVLQQAEVVERCRGQFDELLVRVKRQLFVEMFGDPNPKFNSRWPIVRLGKFVTVATGGTPSRAQADSYGSAHAWVKSTDLKDGLIDTTEERVSELGIQRSNAKLYPKQTVMLAMYGQGQTRGRTGKLLIEAACNQACAALLPSEELLPDYLWIWLQLSYESVRALGRGGQQENLNLDIVRGIQLSKPPVPLQQEFSRRLTGLLDLFKQSRDAREQLTAMLEVLRIDALTGEATAVWREQHADEIVEGSRARATLLRERGAKTTLNTNVVVTSSIQTDSITHPERHWLLSELNEFQRQVLTAFTDYCLESGQPLLVEDPEVFSRFCDHATVTERLQVFGQSHGNRVRRSLSQLASLGLIAKITLPKQYLESGELDYLKAFRPLRPEEFTRMADLQTLRKTLSSSVDQHHYLFEVQLDYETSAHAGASGMFQVIAVKDEDGKDFTHFVDLGKHYASLNDLKEDIASALKVEARQVDLESV
ncbi:restriction endonuclease subunit S [Pantoea sp. JK]|uniref:restriction endonuclease subunit S n=1 Tax=Pantoea sp. JK TaxID=2871703 RepID=UPI002238D8EF|nr:restriction endonuclease subunit S [Pantoea sp. JK]MCW6032431.1 restriction endonuclease subunit S [Pantoea sp. JK]